MSNLKMIDLFLFYLFLDIKISFIFLFQLFSIIFPILDLVKRNNVMTYIIVHRPHSRVI